MRIKESSSYILRINWIIQVMKISINFPQLISSEENCFFWLTNRLNGGAHLLEYFHSIPNAIQSIFPEYEWIPWKFQPSRSDIWNDIEMVRKFMDWASKKLQIQGKVYENVLTRLELGDWLMVSQKDFHILGGTSLVQKYKGVVPLLQSVYPSHDFRLDFKQLHSKTQARKLLITHFHSSRYWRC